MIFFYYAGWLYIINILLTFINIKLLPKMDYPKDSNYIQKQRLWEEQHPTILMNDHNLSDPETLGCMILVFPLGLLLNTINIFGCILHHVLKIRCMLPHVDTLFKNTGIIFKNIFRV